MAKYEWMFEFKAILLDYDLTGLIDLISIFYSETCDSSDDDSDFFLFSISFV